MVRQALQSDRQLLYKIRDVLIPLAFGFEEEFANETLKEIDSIILVPFMKSSDNLFNG